MAKTGGKSENFLYIFRQFCFLKSGGIRIDEEGVFSSFEKAEEYLKTVIDEEYSVSDRVYFRNEITKLKIDSADDWDSRLRWIYSVSGQLIKKIDFSAIPQSDYDQFAYDMSFEVGVLVKVSPKIDAYHSPFINEEYAVVEWRPLSKAEWVESKKEKEDWDGMYRIAYITPEGLLNHQHVPEYCLSHLDQEPPSEFVFLIEYGKRLKSQSIDLERYQSKHSSDILVINKEKWVPPKD